MSDPSQQTHTRPLHPLPPSKSPPPPPPPPPPPSSTSHPSQSSPLQPPRSHQPQPLPLPFPVYPPPPHQNSLPPFQYPYQYPPPQYLPPVYSLPTWPSPMPPTFYSWSSPPPPQHAPPSQHAQSPDDTHMRRPHENMAVQRNNGAAVGGRPLQNRHVSPRRRVYDGVKQRMEGEDTDKEMGSHVQQGHHHMARRGSRRKIAFNKDGMSNGGGGAGGGPGKGRIDDPKGAGVMVSVELERAARKAVESADEVTLALLLTSWANSLEEGRVEGGDMEFGNVFNGSRALEIVVGDVLKRGVGEGVRKGILGLVGFVCYGDLRVWKCVIDEIERLRGEGKRGEWWRERERGIDIVLGVLRRLRERVRAYADVLPGGGEKGASRGGGPAGLDATKAVEREMDVWRRGMARLQGEMAIIGVLKKGLREVERELRIMEGVEIFEDLNSFYSTIRNVVMQCINQDMELRKTGLDSTFWVAVTSGAEGTVFDAAKKRAGVWVRQFECARSEVESQLDDAGIGFGPSARVLEEKFSVLVAASAGVAGLVSCHQHAFSWAKDVGNLLRSMVMAFYALERISCGELGPPAGLKKGFLKGVEDTFGAIDKVVNWSFASLHDKVLGSLEKSCGLGCGEAGVVDTVRQKGRSLRFEEPSKSKNGGEDTEGVHSRRKPRHARMKSSPDALLHLNAHMDDYPSCETEVEGEMEGGAGAGECFGPSPLASPRVNGAGENGEYEKRMMRGGEEEELRAVPEGGLLEFDEDEEDPDDHEIIVHEDVEGSAKPKKVNHSSHVRSMSVDGIPF